MASGDIGDAFRRMAHALLLRQRRDAGYASNPISVRVPPAELVGPAVALAETSLKFAEQAIIGYPDPEYEFWWKQIAHARDVLLPLLESMKKT